VAGRIRSIEISTVIVASNATIIEYEGILLEVLKKTRQIKPQSEQPVTGQRPEYSFPPPPHTKQESSNLQQKWTLGHSCL
jgi:hypothetical protein